MRGRPREPFAARRCGLQTESARYAKTRCHGRHSPEDRRFEEARRDGAGEIGVHFDSCVEPRPRLG